MFDPRKKRLLFQQLTNKLVKIKILQVTLHMKNKFKKNICQIKSVNLRYKFNTYLLSGILHRPRYCCYSKLHQSTLTVPPMFALLTVYKQNK